MSVIWDPEARMDSTEIRTIYILFVVILALPISWNIGARWEAKNPEKLPFKWGYFQSICSILGIVMAVLALIGLSENENSGTLQFLSVFGIAHGIAGIFMLRRNRWWWIIGILLTLNPIFWIANGIYLSNRWREMHSEARKKSPEKRSKVVFPALLFLRQQENEAGPYHWDQVIAKWNSSEITADVLFRESVDEEWKPLLPYFASIKKPWTFGRVVKRSILILLGVIALWLGACLVSVAYDNWEKVRSSRSKIQNSFAGLSLRGDSDEILFTHGEPYEKKEERWIYHEEYCGSYSHSFLVVFTGNHVAWVICTGGANAPDLMGFNTGSAYGDVLNRLGSPSMIINSKDKLSRIIYYDKLNSLFIFTKAQLDGYGIYDSENGRPDINPDWSFK